MSKAAHTTIKSTAPVILAITIGVGGFFWPTPSMELPPPHSIPKKEERQNTSVGFSKFTPRFDMSALPMPPPPPQPKRPPPDPFAQLKRFRLSGVIESDGKSIIFLTHQTETVKKILGDTVFGATVSAITSSSVTFTLNDLQHTLYLNDS